MNTNDKLAETIAAIDELIAWARADMEASYEARATEQGDDDRYRVSQLMQAKRSLEVCRR